MMAKKVGEANKVLGGTLNITQGTGGGGSSTDDISFMSPTFTSQCPTGFATVGDTCIRVNVYRNAGNNPLPVFFAPLFGRTQQGVRATATAVITGGNATNCMRPLGLPDKFDEWDPLTNGVEYETQTGFPDPSGLTSTGWDPDYYVPLPTGDSPGYNTWDANPLIPEPDRYVAPSSSSAGTTYRLRAPNTNAFCCDYGQQLKLTIGAQGNGTGGFFQPLRVAGTGADDYRDAIAGCDGVTRVIGGDVDPELGTMVGPTRQGILDLIAKDPTAQWYAPNTTFGNGLQCPSYGGCIYSSANGTINSSIRIMPVPVFNVDTFMQNPNGVSPIAIKNLIGLFAERIDGSGPNQQIVVRIVPAPGFVAGCPPGVSSCTIVSTASFLRAIVLVR